MHKNIEKSHLQLLKYRQSLISATLLHEKSQN